MGAGGVSHRKSRRDRTKSTSSGVGHGAAQEPPLKHRKMKEATTVFEIKTDHPDSDDTDSAAAAAAA